MHEALFYTAVKNEMVQCYLCPQNCRIKPGDLGDCRVRMNRSGMLSSEVYGKVEALNLDPVEKKPLYHFFPGTRILSVGTAGCNLHCQFCQNHELSQCGITGRSTLHEFTPDELVGLAKETPDNIGLAFTYNEPVVNYEFMLNTAVKAKAVGLQTAMISNGYIHTNPLQNLLEAIDAFNIDLKAFNRKFYQKYCKGRLAPVLDAIKQIAKTGKHLELTTLVIPGLNDDFNDFEMLCRWIADETGNSTVLHLSRYFPGYRLRLAPTPAKTLFQLYDLAKDYLHHVYLGNLYAGDHADTFCPHCHAKLIERNAFRIRLRGIDARGNCQTCQTNVIKYHLYESIST